MRASYGFWVIPSTLRGLGMGWGDDEKRRWSTNYHTHDTPDGKQHWYVAWWLGPFFFTVQSGPYHP